MNALLHCLSVLNCDLLRKKRQSTRLPGTSLLAPKLLIFRRNQVLLTIESETTFRKKSWNRVFLHLVAAFGCCIGFQFWQLGMGKQTLLLEWVTSSAANEMPNSVSWSKFTLIFKKICLLVASPRRRLKVGRNYTNTIFFIISDR